MARILILLAGLLLAGPAAAQSLTLTNLKGPIARAAGKPPARTVAELWAQIRALPPAAPVFEPTLAIAPALEGLASIASGVPIAPNLERSWGTGALPGPEDPNEGAFRFVCVPSHLAYDDPIIYPNQPGRSHLHEFFGNTRADARSTYASLRTTGESTCNNLLNRSAYWVAAMMHPSGKVVRPDYITIYYKRPPQTSKYCAPPYAKACLPLPRGLRYVFGYDMIGGRHDPANMRWWNCDGPGAVSGHFPTIAAAAKGCPKGARIGGAIISPNCWNGRDLDSPDHRLHMAFREWPPELGEPRCPATHPYLLPFFEAIPWYMNDGTAVAWKLSSDIQHGTEGGVTLHADWFGAWEDSMAARWIANCVDKARSCTGGDLGDGSQLRTDPKAVWPVAVRLADIPPAPASNHGDMQ